MKVQSVVAVSTSSHYMFALHYLFKWTFPPLHWKCICLLPMREVDVKFNIKSHIPIFILLNQQNQPGPSSCSIPFPWHPWHNALLISSYWIVRFFVSSDNGVALNFLLVLNDPYPVFSRPSHLSLQIMCPSTWFCLQGCYPCTSYYHS